MAYLLGLFSSICFFFSSSVFATTQTLSDQSYATSIKVRDEKCSTKNPCFGNPLNTEDEDGDSHLEDEDRPTDEDGDGDDIDELEDANDDV